MKKQIIKRSTSLVLVLSIIIAMTFIPSTISSASIPYYYASDYDFTKDSFGHWRYTGSEPFVEIPHYINGEFITSYEYMFSGSTQGGIQSSPVLGVRSDNSSVTSMRHMFSEAEDTPLDLSELCTDGVTDMFGMFQYIKKGNGYDILDLSSFNTSQVTSMAMMFRGSRVGAVRLNSFDTSQVTDMTFMFTDSAFTQLDLSSFNTENVVNMHRMFESCQTKSLDLTSFDTSKVATMSYMFERASATSINVTSFDTRNVTDMHDMFSQTNTDTLDLSSFDIYSGTNISYMFFNAKATNGIAKSQSEVNLLNGSSGKPSGLTFIYIGGPPGMPTIHPSTTIPTNQDVTIDITPSWDSTLVEYSVNGGAWKTWNGVVKFSSNGNIKVKSRNEDGLWSEIASYEVTNIDKTPPIITIGSYNTAPTNQDIKVTASTNEGTLNRTSHTFTKNGSFTFIATDEAGNTTSKTVTISNIDKTPPIITIGDYSTAPTNKDITVTASTNKGTLNETSYTFKSNGSFTFIATDLLGNVATKTITITNIDRTHPIITIGDYSKEPTNQSITVTASTNEGTLNKTSHTFTENGSFTFTATDEAGNTTSRIVTINNIYKENPSKPIFSLEFPSFTVRVTIDYCPNSTVKLYKINDGSWQTYTAPFTAPRNSIVHAKGVDPAGNESEPTYIDVLYIIETEETTYIQGVVHPTIVSIEIPTSVEFTINPNGATVAEKFVSPDIKVKNTCNAPLNIAIDSFRQSATHPSNFQDVAPTKYTALQWSTLNKAKSMTEIALGIRAKPSNWRILNKSDALYAVNATSKTQIGVLNPSDTVTFNLVANHGNSFENNVQLKYNINWVFSLAE